MPRKSEWFHRIPTILEELRALSCPVIDRRTLEQLLGVSPRQALRILQSLVPFSAGKSLLIDRVALIEKLERLDRQDELQVERRRRDRLDEQLRRARRELAARRVRIPVPSPARPGEPDSFPLPAGVQLTPGRLVIEFSDPQDLLRLLLELARAISGDYSRFEELARRSDLVPL